MSLPRKYPPQFQPEDWNAMVDRVNGVTLSGVRSYPFSFLVRNNSGVYEAIDSYHNLVYGGTDDANDVEGTDASAVIQAALDNLTPARTWKETVVVQGYFAPTASMEIPSRTKLILDAELDFSEVNVDGFTIMGDTMGVRKREIEIYGGWIHGAGAGSTTTGLNVEGTDFLRVYNTFIEDFNIGVYEYGCWVKNTIRDSQIAGNQLYNMQLSYTHTNLVENCDISNVRLDTGASVRIDDGGYAGSTANHFISDVIEGNVGVGILMLDSGDNVFEKCYFEFNESYDYYEDADIYHGRNMNNQLKSCRFDESDTILRRGSIDSYRTNNLQILNCEFRNSFSHAYTAAILLGANTSKALIQGNTHYPEGDSYTGVMPLVELDSGATATIKDNPTWVTENSGYAEGTGIAQNISHGCNFTPSLSEICVTNIDGVAGWTATISDDGHLDTYFVVTATDDCNFRWEVKRKAIS